MDELLDKIKKEILGSYNLSGGVNHIGGPSLPSRESITKIIETTESLMFPGFQSNENLEEGILSNRTSEKINLLFQDLYQEIKKATCFKLKREDNCNCINCEEYAKDYTNKFISKLTQIRSMLLLDVDAALRGDPAASTMEEVILSYPGLKAVMVHRIAHEFYKLKIPLIPRMMGEHAHSLTGIDIHPGATIGNSFFIDHGTGVVIGETTIIGSNVKIYQGVTLGALSVKKEEAHLKRHPTIEDGVTIYAGATILGGDTVVGKDSTIGGNIWITKSVKENSKVYYTPADYDIRN
ncbi:MAG: serine acetyltransferase [Spirochaetaceae bacterium]